MNVVNNYNFSIGEDDRKRIKQSVPEAISENFLYIDTGGTIYTDNIKDRYPHIPIIELSYKKNFAELMKLQNEQR